MIKGIAQPTLEKNDVSRNVDIPYMTDLGTVLSGGVISVSKSLLISPYMIAIATAMEMIVNSHDNDIPFSVITKSDCGIITSTIPATVPSAPRIGDTEVTYWMLLSLL